MKSGLSVTTQVHNAKQDRVSGLAHLQLAKIIPGPRFAVFEYLTSPENLKSLLHGMIAVEWQNSGVTLQPGSEFLFVMKRFGIEQPIRFVIDKMVLGHSLTYRQQSGVYSRLVHTMKFDERDTNETLVTDLVEYELPFGILGRICDDIYVKHDFSKMLEWRLNRARDHFLNLSSASLNVNPVAEPPHT